METLKSIGATGLLLLVCFYLVRDVLAPLVKSVTRKGKTEPKAEPVEVQNKEKIAVLAIDLSRLTAQVTDFHALLEQNSENTERQFQAVDDKIDIVLSELKEIRDEFGNSFRAMTERIAKAETHIEHILRTRAARGQN